jgi:predicted amidohydrolase
VRVLLGQLAPVHGEPEQNAERVRQALSSHPEAELAVFPELFLSGYEAAVTEGLAITASDGAVRIVAEAAAEYSTSVLVGFPESLEDGSVANAVGCATVSGDWFTAYRKAYLFGPRERKAFVEGDHLALVDMAGQTLAPLVCFDIEFPEPARALAMAGADVLVTVAANMDPYGPDHRLAAQARALDNRRPHVYVNRVGVDGELRFVGGSLVAAADGSIVRELGDQEEVALVELEEAPPIEELDYLAQIRELPTRRVGP